MADIDLATLLPTVNRDELNDSYMANLFNRHLSKDASSILIGYVGDKAEGDTSIYLPQENIDRSHNALQPMFKVLHGATEYVFNYNDLIQKLALMDIDPKRIADFMKDKTFNLMFPINLDKFVNFQEYYWNPNGLLPFDWNPNMVPEYYVIEASGKSDWAITNIWSHIDDLQTNGVDLSTCIQATRPIIEYKVFLESELNNRYNSTTHEAIPTQLFNKVGNSYVAIEDNGVAYQQSKTRVNQKPLFNLYTSDGAIAKISPIVYFKEDTSAVFDTALNARVVMDEFNDFIISHDLIDLNSEFLFYNIPDTTQGSTYEFSNGVYSYRAPASPSSIKSIWGYGSTYTPAFIVENNGVESSLTDTSTIASVYEQGAWEVHKNIQKNIDHQLNADIKYADLLSHFMSIMSAQQGFYGSKFGKNNFRLLSKVDLSLGGEIKEFDKDFALFFGIINQQDMSVAGLISFAKNSYSSFINSIENFVKDYLANDFVTSTDSYDANAIMTKLVENFQVQTANGAQYFYDSTSNVKNVIATLPYLRLADAVQPEITRDDVLNVPVLVHHDGHRSRLTLSDDAFNKTLVARSYTRSNSKTTPGIITSGDPFALLEKPYRKQFWYNPATGVLKIFNVISDEFNYTVNANEGEYSYDRINNIVYKYTNNAWEIVANDPMNAKLWVDFNVLSFCNEVKLEVENKLYSGLDLYNLEPSGSIDPWEMPWVNSQYDILRTQNLAPSWLTNKHTYLYDHYMEKELYRYAADKGVDPYVNYYYNAANAFTWNYKPLSGNYDSAAATWFDLYQDVYGTRRPDLNTASLLGLTQAQFDSYINTHSDLIQNFAIGFDVKRYDDTVNAAIVTGFKPHDIAGRIYRHQLWFNAASGLYIFDVLTDQFVDNDTFSAPVGTIAYNTDSNTYYQNVDGDFAWVQLSTSEGESLAWVPVSVNSISASTYPIIKWSAFYFYIQNEQPVLNAAYDNVKFSVDPNTNRLLPPYVSADDYNSKYALFSDASQIVVPLNGKFSFGDHGLVEYAWMQSIDYNYARLVALFKCNPYEFICKTWGYLNKKVQTKGDLHTLSIDRYKNKKINKTEFLLHGEAMTATTSKSDLIMNLKNDGAQLKNIVVSAVNEFARKYDVFYSADVNGKQQFSVIRYKSISIGGDLTNFTYVVDSATSTVNVGDTFTDDTISFSITTSNYGYRTGDLFEIFIPANETTSTYTWNPADLSTKPELKFEAKVVYTDDTKTMFQISKYLRYPSVSSSTASTWERQSQAWSCGLFETVQLAAISFKIGANRVQYMLGDTFVLNVAKDESTVDVSFVSSPTFVANGLNQWYVNYLRFNNMDPTITLNNQIFRNWTLKLGYRVSGLINSQLLSIKTDYFSLNRDNFEVLLKTNPSIANYTAQALRMTLVKVGTSTMLNGIQVPATNSAGDTDWTFRVMPMHPNRPFVEIYVPNNVYDASGTRIQEAEYITFDALARTNCPLAWKHYVDYKKDPITGKNKVITVNLPIDIRGIQNVVDFMFAYSDKLKDDGWIFNSDSQPEIDTTTGRRIDWQLEIEKFVDQQWLGNPTVGSGYIAAPFKQRIGLTTTIGTTAPFNVNNYVDSWITPGTADLYGNYISTENYRVIRNDEWTNIYSNIPMFFINANIDEKEHVILFDDYVDGNMIFNSFLGMRATRLHITSQKQNTFNGKLSYGGYYLNGGAVFENIEKSIDNVGNIYDIDKMIEGTSLIKYLKDTVGFVDNTYYTNLSLSQKGSIQLWQGTIKAKGTVKALNAFINNARYTDAKIDEYWAYKICDYGDARFQNYPEIKLTHKMTLNDYTKFAFNDGTKSFFIADENVISSGDDSTWFDIIDLKSPLYSEAQVNFTKTFDLSSVDNVQNMYIDVKDSNGNYVFADSYEIQLTGDYEGLIAPAGLHDPIVDEQGNDILSGYTFDIINNSTIQLKDPLLKNLKFRLVGYGPAFSKFNPAKVINYKDNIVENPLEFFDPARGKIFGEHETQIDMSTPYDPARYNYVLDISNNINYSENSYWNESQVGKIWNNTENDEWTQYHDAHVYPEINDRISIWGNRAQYSTPEIYQWVKSSVLPENFEAYAAATMNSESNENLGGEPAFKDLYYRDRTWYGRPIGWRKASTESLDPSVVPYRSFTASGDARLIMSGLDASGSNVRTLCLSQGSFAGYGVTTGMHVAGSYITPWTLDPYGNVTMTDVREPTSIFGDTEITTSDFVVVGSSNGIVEPAINFDTNVFAKIEVTVLNSALMDILGAVYFSNTFDGSTYTITATAPNAGISESIDASDLVGPAGTVSLYIFNTLNIQVSVTSAQQDVSAQLVAETVGSAGMDVFLYGAVNGITYIPHYDANTQAEISTFPAMGELANMSWVAWKNPTQSQLTNDTAHPYNMWEPIYGDYVKVNPYNDVINTDIRTYLKAPLTLSDGTVIAKYTYSWSTYSKIEDQYFRRKYLGDVNVYDLGFDLTGLENRLEYYENGFRKNFSLSATGIIPNPMDTGGGQYPAIGTYITIILRGITPTTKQLSWDPAVSDPDPSITRMYKYDYRYSYDVAYNLDGTIKEVAYYFWVKNNPYKYGKKEISIKNIANALIQKNDPFIGLYDYANIDFDLGYPERYRSFFVKKLNQYVKNDNRFKLRLTRDFVLRNTYEDMNLKNHHAEWVLLRRFQKSRLPRILWDRLTDTLCARTSTGLNLPYDNIASYDLIHGTKHSFGVGEGQVMTDVETAKQIIIYTIRNTELRKTVFSKSGNIVTPDYINFDGFNMNNLELYLANEISIRKFMYSLWTLANPDQINEIFFAVLDDSLKKNLEYKDIFKTSKISLHSVKLFHVY